MTKALCRRFYECFQMDPDIFADMTLFRSYEYSPERADAVFDRQIALGREYFTIMLDEEPIGEIILKNVDREKKCCTLSIHLKDDSCKNKGYGTQAEILALNTAFQDLGMETVYADAIQKNKRSQHVLEKVGFIETHQDETFRYYRCDKASWNGLKARL